jgi:hypothetical protein
MSRMRRAIRSADRAARVDAVPQMGESGLHAPGSGGVDRPGGRDGHWRGSASASAPTRRRAVAGAIPCSAARPTHDEISAEDRATLRSLMAIGDVSATMSGFLH